MSLLNAINIAGMGMTAQSTRLNLVASNLANAESTAGSSATVYRARHPVFQAVATNQDGFEEVFYGQASGASGVTVAEVVESQVPPRMRYEPGHSLANEEGYVFSPDINPMDEMANMISASRSYQTNVQVAETAKQLLMRTLSLGQS